MSENTVTEWEMLYMVLTEGSRRSGKPWIYVKIEQHVSQQEKPEEESHQHICNRKYKKNKETQRLSYKNNYKCLSHLMKTLYLNVQKDHWIPSRTYRKGFHTWASHNRAFKNGVLKWSNRIIVNVLMEKYHSKLLYSTKHHSTGKEDQKTSLDKDRTSLGDANMRASD